MPPRAAPQSRGPRGGSRGGGRDSPAGDRGRGRGAFPGGGRGDSRDSSPGGDRGRGRGAFPGGGRGSSRGASPAGGRGGGGAARGRTQVGLPGIAATVTTVGVKRPDYGTTGTVFNAQVNAFATSIPESIIYHYDAINPATLPRTRNQEIIKILQRETAPTVFTQCVPYDGNKNIYSPYKLSLGNEDTGEVRFYYTMPSSRRDGQPKLTPVKITLAQKINPNVLARFVNGEMSQDVEVQTALMGIGGGFELWRGFFQSVRPTIGRVLVNVDISTAMMFKSGPLIGLAGLPDRERLRLQKFLVGVCVIVETERNTGGAPRKRAIKGLSKVGADQIMFPHDGQNISVAQYFQRKFGRALQFPKILCVELGTSKAYYPLEVCNVPAGQIARKQVPPEKTKAMVEFATKKPNERLEDIRRGVDILQYGQSDYIREFGMNINTADGPLAIQMRKLQTPTLRYGQGSKAPTVVPNNGAWNMVDKKFYAPTEPIHRWVIVVYERQQRFNPDAVEGMIRDFITGCASVGITVTDNNPIYKYENPQGDIGNMGVATQCVKSGKAFRAKPQYWANVILKPCAVSAISDPSNPTIVMGADVIHPAPGSEGRPSFTALVGSIDGHCAKYVATNRAQTGRQEIIDDLQAMVVNYRRAVENKTSSPTRLIFYRDGVSEGQFAHVLERELPLIKAACAELGIKPKITLIVVGKRHHIRSGNCPAGSVADQGIAHPTEFDFYLQSHGGLLGTSRPAHYSENGFSSNSLQLLSFGLCHVYARSTRSVSIPAPVYYADIVCSRAKHHYDPNGDLGLSETATQISASGGSTMLEAFKAAFKPLHANQQRLMYFSVSFF
ncbi:Piwi domain-containing protein [Cyathus striatus]|nr:Piwi domain-containing protein [Cyathus striatus]